MGREGRGEEEEEVEKEEGWAGVSTKVRLVSAEGKRADDAR